MKRPGRYLPPLALALLMTSLANATDLPSMNAYGKAQPAEKAGSRASSGATSAIAASLDEKRGVPTFMWAPPDLRAAPAQSAAPSAEQAALYHLSRIASLY